MARQRRAGKRSSEMPRCTLQGHIEFKHGHCVECRRRRQREYMAECRSARRRLKAIEAALAAA